MKFYVCDVCGNFVGMVKESGVSMMCFGYYGKGINAMMEEVATAEGEDLNEILTAREIEILRFCAQGFSAKEIAERLQLSVRTVEGHKNHIYGKMGFESIGELVNYAFTHGIITA